MIVGAFPSKDSRIYGGIVTTCKSLLDSEFSEHFDLVLIDSTQRSNPPPNFFLRFIFALRKLYLYLEKLFTTSPDAVLLFTATGVSILEKGMMARFARLKRIPVFMFPRGGEVIDIVKKSAVHRAWIRPALRSATYLLCQGPAWQRFAVQEIGFPAEKAPIMHNWTATPELLQLGAEKKLTLSDAIPRLAFIGWLEKEKGVFELLAACRCLAQRHHFLLTIAGRGNAESAAKEYVRRHSLEEYVNFVGWVQDEEKRDLLRYADILVLPSWAEGFPNVVIEAMAAKLAIVVTTVGNVPDLLTDRRHALLIPSRNVDAIAVAVEELLIDRVFRSELAERGYEFANTMFSTAAGISRLVAIIKDAARAYKASRN